jgi:hypothetical protein
MLRSALGDPARAEQVALAAYELIDNAVKYSLSGTPIRVAIDGEDITVESQPLADHLVALEAEIEAMRGAADPLAYYRGRLESSSEHEGAGSRVGLARVQWEAGMRLSLRRRGGRIEVAAQRR